MQCESSIKRQYLLECLGIAWEGSVSQCKTDTKNHCIPVISDGIIYRLCMNSAVNGTILYEAYLCADCLYRWVS